MHAALGVAALLLCVARTRSRRLRFAIVNAPASKPRLARALRLAAEEYNLRCVEVHPGPDAHVDFLWSNSNRSSLDPAIARLTAAGGVYNHLCGAQCFEDKFLLALLAGRECNVDSTALKGVQAVAEWCRAAHDRTPALYVLKDARANGAAGIWLFEHPTQRAEYALHAILPQLNPEARYVIQRYVANPLLWQHTRKKFHFRVLGVLRADSSAYLHRLAFVHPSNKAYDFGATLDRQVHITNLCANFADKNSPDAEFVGEVLEDLSVQRPDLFQLMLALWGSVCDACDAMFSVQRGRSDFEYIGLDFLADDCGQVHLLEANCPPAMVSPTGHPVAEALHDALVLDMCRAFVVGPLANVREPSLGGFVQVPRRLVAWPRSYLPWPQARAHSALALAVKQRKLAAL
jgi:hypothetical protein